LDKNIKLSIFHLNLSNIFLFHLDLANKNGGQLNLFPTYHLLKI